VVAISGSDTLETSGALNAGDLSSANFYFRIRANNTNL